jgi:hypothetical protein
MVHSIACSTKGLYKLLGCHGSARSIYTFGVIWPGCVHALHSAATPCPGAPQLDVQQPIMVETSKGSSGLELASLGVLLTTSTPGAASHDGFLFGEILFC